MPYDDILLMLYRRFNATVNYNLKNIPSHIANDFIRYFLMCNLYFNQLNSDALNGALAELSTIVVLQNVAKIAQGLPLDLPTPILVTNEMAQSNYHFNV